MKFSMKKIQLVAVLASAALVPAALEAAPLAGGSATLTFDQTALNTTAISTLNAVFGGTPTETRAFVLDSVNAGNPFTMPSITLGINPGSVTSPTGRSAQATTLDVSPGDVLGTWTPASDATAFLSGGEQIGLEGMTRWTGMYPGVLLFGDFAIRYSPSRVGVVRGGNTLSGLVITSNIDFLNATYADIGNVSIVSTNSGLSIDGDLVWSDGLSMLSGTPTGLDFGDFSLDATYVPEPASLAVLGWGCLMLARRRSATCR